MVGMEVVNWDRGLCSRLGGSVGDGVSGGSWGALRGTVAFGGTMERWSLQQAWGGPCERLCCTVVEKEGVE